MSEAYGTFAGRASDKGRQSGRAGEVSYLVAMNEAKCSGRMKPAFAFLGARDGPIIPEHGQQTDRANPTGYGATSRDRWRDYRAIPQL